MLYLLSRNLKSDILCSEFQTKTKEHGFHENEKLLTVFSRQEVNVLACNMFFIICVFVFFNCIFALSFVYLYLCIIICLFVFLYYHMPIYIYYICVFAEKQKERTQSPCLPTGS